MKPTIQLINALRKAADRIENDRSYDFLRGQHCNCGFLAQELLGIDSFRLKNLLSMANHIGCWRTSGEIEVSRCETTGRPMAEVYARLANAGFGPKDFGSIEFLNDESVRERMGAVRNGRLGVFDNPANVARYFRAQADILAEQLAEQFETRPITVSKPAPAGQEVVA